MATTVKFKINTEKELEYLHQFAKVCGTSKIKPEHLGLLSLDKDVAIKAIEEGYKKQEFIEFVKQLKKEWKNIEGEYFQKIKEFTGFDWKYKTYTCYISLSVPGLGDIFDGKYNKMILSNILPAKIMKYVLAHELFHLHYFNVCKKGKMSAKAVSTGVNESIPILLMVANPELSKLWSDITLDKVRNSYPEVNRIIDPLLDFYKTEKDFKKLIEKAVELNEQAVPAS
ncbi:MAG: hypothetical protein PHH54_04200 [Candidatus Nanoarchaeia archaeon]|nr:hypothetical protein [Candidatus Nanoarchaeia archaeon]MDD5741162.1 hypothetical protein [Candidatus Nanoarchaeia archaeon]